MAHPLPNYDIPITLGPAFRHRDGYLTPRDGLTKVMSWVAIFALFVGVAVPFADPLYPLIESANLYNQFLGFAVAVGMVLISEACMLALCTLPFLIWGEKNRIDGEGLRVGAMVPWSQITHSEVRSTWVSDGEGGRLNEARRLVFRTISGEEIAVSTLHLDPLIVKRVCEAQRRSGDPRLIPEELRDLSGAPSTALPQKQPVKYVHATDKP